MPLMMEKTNIKWTELTDNAILNQLGAFIKETRLSQNKTQQSLGETGTFEKKKSYWKKSQ